MIIKSAERNANNIYLARLEILGFDRNQNRASPMYSTSIISPSTSDRSFGSNHLEYDSSPTHSSYCNGNISSVFQGTSTWTTSPTQSVRLITASMNDLSPSTPFTFAQSTRPPPPPPGLEARSPLQIQTEYTISPTGSYASIESLNGMFLLNLFSIYCCRLFVFVSLFSCFVSLFLFACLFI